MFCVSASTKTPEPLDGSNSQRRTLVIIATEQNDRSRSQRRTLVIIATDQNDRSSS